MVNYSNIFPLSTGSDNNQIIVVNTNTTLNNGGFYQTGNLTTDIEIDISNVPVNDEIAFYNTSTKNVVISGISTVDNVSIPTNKGVSISPNNGGGFIKNISDNINKRLGSYTVDWLPGQEPPYLTFNYSSPSALNGIINAIGTANGTVSYSNPYTSGKISCYPTSGQYSGVPTTAFDKAIVQDAWMAVSNSPPNNYWTITFNNNVTVRMKRLQNYVTSVGGDHFWNGVGNKLTIYGSNDGTNWVFVYEWTLSNESITNRCVSPVFANDSFYKHYKFQPNTSTFYLCWREFECFGDVMGV